MTIRPPTLWRTCIPRFIQATTLAIGEPSCSRALTRIEGTRFAYHSASTSTDGPPRSRKGDGSNPKKFTNSDGKRTKKPSSSLQKWKNERRSKKKKSSENEVDNTEHGTNLPKPTPTTTSGSLNPIPIPTKSSFQEHMQRVLARESFGTQHVIEEWAVEPWSQDLEGFDKVNTDRKLNMDRKLNTDRKYPPHDLPESTLREGISIANIGAETRSVLKDVAPTTEHQPVSELSHGLDRVLFNPGVHWLQDPRSHVYNFTPWLEKLPKVNDFAFERLTGFIRSSRDDELRSLAEREKKKFTGSTSSLSGMLSHIYFLLTRFKEIDCTILSQHFRNEPTTFTPGQRMPTMVMLNYKNGIYAVDSQASETEDPDKNVLTWMGTLLENFLTKPPEAFNTFMRLESSAPSELSEEPVLREAYRYSKSDKFVMRSQLDCHDSRLPGTGVFDIKTRACVSIRLDILNYEENAGYLIKSQHGILQSFEKEYYDLIRSAFLKYSFQVRIGNMDGVFVAYHNTERIFGFQYISLDEMDERLLGPNPGIGDKLFNHCVKLLEAILEEATKCFPRQDIVCLMETQALGKYLDVIVQPAEWSGDLTKKPMKQLRVVVQHELDGKPVTPDTALMSTTEDWGIKYKISKLDIPAYLIKEQHDAMLQRKKRTLVLPSSVTLEKAEEYWRNLNFGNRIFDSKLPPFNPDSFALAQESVEKYRRLAREGRLESQEKEERLAGRPKIVYGHGVYEPEYSPFFPQKPLEQETSPTEKVDDGAAAAEVEEEAKPSSPTE